MSKFIKNFKISSEEVLTIFKNPMIQSFVTSHGFTLSRTKNINMFLNKGSKCDVCGVELSYFKISKEKIKGTYTYGLVGFCTNDVEMTRDHTHPKCAGGNNSLDNLVPMCQKCNGIWKSQFDRMLKEDIIDLTEEYYDI